MNIEFIGRDAIVQTPEVAFTYQVSETPRDFDKLRGTSNSLDWSNNTSNNYYGDYIVFPFGSNNDLPHIIKEVVQNNYIAPGLLKRKTELLWGMGPRLYTEALEDNELVRKWVDDKEVQRWLDKWDAEDYLLKSCVDYQYVQGTFTKFVLNKGFKVAKPFINELQHVSSAKGRLAILKNNFNLNAYNNPSHVVITEWGLNHLSSLTDIKVYPLLKPQTPFDKPNAILYSNMATFCTDYYTVPDIYGSLEWLNRSTAVPLIFKALSKNSINLKYHIVSPEGYWDKKRSEIQSNCNLKGIEFKESMLEDFKTEFLKKIADVLSGDENTGKYLHTSKSFRVDQTNLIEEGWEIKVIDQNIKDFVEAQIKISERADAAVASGVSIHSVLGNMSDSGNSNSGSEQIYAVINYLNTAIDIQEMIICKALNIALRANFPDKNLKIGFYHNVPEKQKDIAPKDRSINNSSAKP